MSNSSYSPLMNTYLQRMEDKTKAMLLCMPAFATVILPIAILVLVSIWSGHNYISPGFDTIRPYAGLFTGLAMIVTVPIARTLMIVIGRDIAETINEDHAYPSLTLQKNFHLWRISRSEWLLWIGYFVGGSVCAATGLAAQLVAP